MTSRVMDSGRGFPHAGSMTTNSILLFGPVVDSRTPARTAAQRLRNILRLNATTSFAGAGVAVAAPAVLDRLLGTGQPGWIRIVGAGLGLFAIDVALVAGSRTRRLRTLTPFIIVADGLWVIGTALTIALGWYAMGGAVVLGAVGVMVATFAALQLRTHRALGRALGLDEINESPPIEVAHVETRLDAPAALAWEIVTDHELYGTLAPNLASVAATGPNGPGLIRTCSDRRNLSWNESCTLWDDGQRFEVAVDTSDYPYPLAVMRGSWWVRDGRGSSTVGMDFQYQPRRGAKGFVMAAVMQAAFPPVLGRIMRGWSAEATRRNRTVS